MREVCVRYCVPAASVGQAGWLALVGLVVLCASVSLHGQTVATSDHAQVKATIGEAGANVLRDYIDRPDDNFQWQVRHRSRLGACEMVELALTSQVWKNIPWRHRLFLVLPDNMKNQSDAVLLIEGGRWRARDAGPIDPENTGYPKEAILLAGFAQQLGSPFAILMQVPQQPIFDGLVEDEIIAYTFDKFLTTRDTDWPLLLPMVKSAVRAMDALQAFAVESLPLPIEEFTVIGASKRGWTTWLTAAMDDRVKGLGPMVIDMLNLKDQLKHQFDAWGEYSERVSDYSELNVLERMGEPQGDELRRIVDPYHYRDLLTQPKLLMLGTNDLFWTVDAMNLYWDDLVGKKYVIYVPNGRHDLAKDFQRVLGGVCALHYHTTGVQPLPELQWEYESAGDGVSLSVDPGESVTMVRLWSATSPTRDFRHAVWTATLVSADASGQYVASVPEPASGYQAVFAEMVYPRTPMTLYLSTTVRVLGSDD